MDGRSELVTQAVYFGELPDGDGLLAAVAENADGSGFSMHFSVTTTWDEQDIDLGMDTYCISTGEGATHYGGVLALRTGKGFTDIDLEPTAAKTLDVPACIRITLAVAPDLAEAFNVGIARVLGVSVEE